MADASSARKPFLETPNSDQHGKAVIKRRISYGEFSVHCISLIAIAVLLWANLTKQFWAEYDPSSTTTRNGLRGWQFAAKLHELFMLSSLSFLVFYYMRRLLLGSSGVPFGLVSITYNITPSVLIRKSFWKGLPVQLPFGMLVAAACLLSVILGPSSAIMMIPALGWFERGSQDWAKVAYLQDWRETGYLQGPNEIWRTVFDNNITGRAAFDRSCLVGDPERARDSCPSSGFPDIIKSFIGSISTNASSKPAFKDYRTNAERTVSFRHDIQWGDTEAMVETTGVTVTVVTKLIAQTLGGLLNYASNNDIGGIGRVTYPRFRVAENTPIYQPLVHVNCHLNILKDYGKIPNTSFPLMRSPWVEDTASYSDPFVLGSDDSIWDGIPNMSPRFQWLKDTRDITLSSLLALAVIPVVPFNLEDDSAPSSLVIPCSIDARWAPSSVYVEPSGTSKVSSNVSDHFESSFDPAHRAENRAQYGLSESPLDLGLDWAAYLNIHSERVTINETNKNSVGAIADLLSSGTLLWPDDITEYISTNTTTTSAGSAVREFVATLLGFIVTDGIAQTNDVSPLLYTEPSASQGGSFTSLLTFRRLDLLKSRYPSLPENLLQIKFEQYGYGYGFRSATSWAAIAALILYALLVIGHMVQILIMHMRKRHLGSDGWDTVGDILALAMNSKPSARLYGTSGGVHDGSTWQEIVKIRETGGEHLELQFDADRQDDAGAMVAVGKKYY